ncbi:Uncharacterised protein [Mycobacterium tuberculosis]|nr:Uncharacterised protein [Mycobacterium tuberculosis]
MPKVNPRKTMLAMATATIAPLTPNHNRRRPTTSNAPVPVYRRERKLWCPSFEAVSVVLSPSVRATALSVASVSSTADVASSSRPVFAFDAIGYPRPVQAMARRSRATCCTAPRPLYAGLASSDDLDARYTNGHVTKNTTTRSRIVVRPRVNANPFT